MGSSPPTETVDKGLKALPTREPKPAANAAARALGGMVSAAVILKDDQGLHWAPALAGVFEGSYCLLVEPVPAEGRRWTTTVEWDRRRNAEGLAALPDLPPGLYLGEESAVRRPV